VLSLHRLSNFRIHDVHVLHFSIHTVRLQHKHTHHTMKGSILLIVLWAAVSTSTALMMPSRLVRSGPAKCVHTKRIGRVAVSAMTAKREEVDDDAIYVADFMSKMKSGFMDDNTSEDDGDDDEYYEEDDDDEQERPSKPTSRYDQLSPLGKSRFQKEAVERKLANNRSESKADKKRSKCV
jgi:hypothetical protein